VRRTVRVHLFATAREAVGRASVAVAVPEAGLLARELIAELARAYPRLAPTLRASRFLRNDRVVPDLESRVMPGDEFAVHPPYGGG